MDTSAWELLNIVDMYQNKNVLAQIITYINHYQNQLTLSLLTATFIVYW